MEDTVALKLTKRANSAQIVDSSYQEASFKTKFNGVVAIFFLMARLVTQSWLLEQSSALDVVAWQVSPLVYYNYSFD